MEKQRDGLTTQIQDMRNEIARLRVDLRTMSERSDGSEWEKKAAEIEELRAELNLVKQERDCAKSEWDRAEGRCKALGGEVAELFSDRQRLKAELAVIKDERNELRAKLEASEAESRGYYEELAQIRRNALPCEPSAPTPRSHPVNVGEWVQRPTGFNATPGCEIAQVISANAYPDGYVEYVVLRPNGEEDAWTAKYCIPCDPPESTNALEDQAAADIKVGNYVEVCDVRKIQRKPKPGDKVRLVNTPVKWESEWGKIGDVGTVKEVSACDDTVRIQETGYWWSVDRIEIVDAK